MIRPSLRDRLLAAYARKGWRGLDRLWSLCRRGPGDAIHAVTPYGTHFELDPWSYIDRIVLREGFYESEVLTALVGALGGEGVLWDIGSNFGLHGLTAKKMVPDARVICFEPSPETLGRLWRNRALNALDVQVVTSGLSNRTGFQAFHLGPPGNSGMSTFANLETTAYAGTCVVASAQGDDLIAGGHLPPPTVIKLDVEGYEREVLEGLGSALRSPALRAVVFEDHAGDATPVKALLRAAGFGFDPLARKEATAHNLENFLASRSPGTR